MLYETILGEQFSKLHPEIQRRYTNTFQHTLLFKGVMETIFISPLLTPVAYLFRPYRFLLPKSGTNIPFTIKLYTRQQSPEVYDVVWERTFLMDEKEYKFDSVMQFNLRTREVVDSLGNPAVVKAPLTFNVSEDGQLLMRGMSGQHLAFLPFPIPIPALFGAKAFVLEGYDEQQQVHTIHLSTYSDSIGNMMRYAGSFTIDVLHE